MSDLRVRRRTRLKQKQSKALREELQAVFEGVDLWPDSAAVETGELPDYQVILVDQQIVGLVEGDKPFLTVRGLLQYRPKTRFVTVDMGAIRFVHNGADVMAPGVVDADPTLQAGDWCWVRDERNGQPLAVGRCLLAGPDMVAATSGKAVASVHHLGDKLWDLDS